MPEREREREREKEREKEYHVRERGRELIDLAGLYTRSLMQVLLCVLCSSILGPCRVCLRERERERKRERDREREREHIM